MVSACWSLKPSSSSVATSGKVARRVLLVIASARILPSLINGTELPMAPHAMGVKPASSRLSHRTPACKGNGDETDPKLLKEFDRQRWRRAGPRGSDTELAGTGLHRVDQLLHRLGRKIAIDRPGVRRGSRPGNGDEILLHVERNFLVQARVHHDAR